jgi:hypothetical protein
MNIEITSHAKERMEKYDLSENLLILCINQPDRISESYRNRKIFERKINGYVLRAIVEESKEIKTIVTVYKARSQRYGI